VLQRIGLLDVADGAGRLLAQMQCPDVSPESLLADVGKFTNGTGLRDDATVILVATRDI